MDTGNLFQAFRISASGLSAQRARLNVISANIANASTTRTPEGGAYKRRVVTFEGDAAGGRSTLFERLLHATRSLGTGLERTSPRHLNETTLPTFPEGDPGVAFSVGVDEETPTRFEYEPGHPDANEDGYVEYPNVEVVHEMVDLMTASRAYEANVTVLNSTKAMLRKALEI
jgi:flagellar basal-body rod protein FlgC